MSIIGLFVNGLDANRLACGYNRCLCDPRGMIFTAQKLVLET